jgi:hypothetical protein
MKGDSIRVAQRGVGCPILTVDLTVTQPKKAVKIRDRQGLLVDAHISRTLFSTQDCDVEVKFGADEKTPWLDF